LDQFSRVLHVVCKFETAILPLLRKVLIDTYKRAGWDGQQASSQISFATLADQLDEKIRQMPSEYARERVILQQRCLPLLRDIALTTEHINWVGTDSLEELLQVPVIMDICELGNESNTALLSGCLWIWYALALTTLAPARRAHPLRGILGLEGAHTLFPLPDRNSNMHPLIALVHTLIQAGVSIVFVDDRPDLLDNEILNNAELTLLTRSTVLPTLKCFDTLIEASPAQKERLRQMEPAEAIVKWRELEPVHIVGV
jgi:hypothetical protein